MKSPADSYNIENFGPFHILAILQHGSNEQEYKRKENTMRKQAMQDHRIAGKQRPNPFEGDINIRC